MVVTRRPHARTTLAAGVLAVLLGLAALAWALSALLADGPVDAQTRSDLLVLGVPEDGSAVRTVGAKAGFCSDSSIMVRSTSSTAVSVPSPSRTMCWAESMAW